MVLLAVLLVVLLLMLLLMLLVLLLVVLLVLTSLLQRLLALKVMSKHDLQTRNRAQSVALEQRILTECADGYRCARCH